MTIGRTAKVTNTISYVSPPRDPIGLGTGQDLRDHVGMHPFAGRVLFSRFPLIGGERIGELAVFSRQNVVLNEQR